MKKCKSIDAFLKTVADSLSDQELLYWYLKYSEPDPQKLADEMISYYGNLANLIDSNPSHLKLEFAIKDETISLLQLLPALRRRYLRIRSCVGEYLVDDDAIHRYLLPLFSGEVNEVLYLVCMDKDRKVLGRIKLNTGDISSVTFSTRLLAEEALLLNASIIILAHNHPSGQPTPSHTDLSNTSSLQENLAHLGIHMLDHYVYANDTVQGMRHATYLNTIRPFTILP